MSETSTLTKVQRTALAWLMGRNQPRYWTSHVTDPPPDVLSYLVAIGMVKRYDGSGWFDKYSITEMGRDALAGEKE